MRTIRIKLYKFDELSEAAKKKAISDNADINTDFDWWDCIYKEAAENGLKITSCDLQRFDCKGKLTNSLQAVCDNIIANHGEDCDTYRTAQLYLKEWEQLVKQFSDDNGTEFDWLAEEQEEQFLKALLNDYCEILQHEYDYLTSDAAIAEALVSNDYEFTARR